MIPHSRPTVIPELGPAVLRVVASGQHAGGAERAAFEGELARLCGVRHAVAVQSGSAALHLALLVLGVPRGARVLAPSYACAALLNAIDAVGGVPLLADVEPASLAITAETARAALAREGLAAAGASCAIVAHALGRPAPLERWDLGVRVVEDAAMALGATCAGRPAGARGTVAIASTYATKMISTGQGGALLTSDDALAADARDRIQYDGREAWRASWNYPLSDLAAALGRPQLAALPGWVERRRAIAARYQRAAERSGRAGPPDPPGSNAYRFLLRFADPSERDAARRAFAARGIEAKNPVHRPLHRYLRLFDRDFPVTTEAWETGLSVPLYPSLEDAEVERIIAAIEEPVLA